MKREPENFILPKSGDLDRHRHIGRVVGKLEELPTNEGFRVTIESLKPVRTLQQNSYLRGVCDVMIAKAVGYEPDKVHEFLCGTYWGWKQVRCPKTPSNPRGIEDNPLRTTTTGFNGERDVLNKQDFWDFVDFVQRFGASHGVIIPDPDPNLASYLLESKAA